MNETPSHRNADPARAGQTRTHGGMWAMWICCLGLMLSFSVLAQQTQQKPQQQSGQMMSMDDMMKGCREHCQVTTGSIDKTLSSIAEAKKANDPAKMRAALDQVEKPLAEMKSHMTMCMNMMNMMQQMQGGKPPAH